jgi:hypothetical protein
MIHKAFRTSLLAALIVVCAVRVSAESVPLSFHIVPQFLAPIGPDDAEGDNLYGLGGGVSLGLAVGVPRLDWLSFIVDAGFDRVKIAYSGDYLDCARGTAGLALTRQGPRLGGSLSGSFGYFYGFYGSESGGNVCWDAMASLLFRVSGPVTLSVSGGWRDYLDMGNSSESFLSRTPVAGIGIHFDPSALSNRPLMKIDDARIPPVFPALLKYYATNPLGNVTLVNAESFDVLSVEVSFFMPAYMERPTVVASYPTIKKGDRISCDLAAVFNPKILSVTEGTVAQGEVTVSYRIGDRRLKTEKTFDLTVYDRNATVWDDDRRAAAFVTTKDQAILTFAKKSASSVAGTKNLVTDRNLRAAIIMFESLSLAGLQYSVDPASSYASGSSGISVDYLQYPAQTLQFRAGDCDDLTILYCALLESVGVPTAMITVPGHIFPAVALAFPEKDVPRFFPNPGDCIVKDGVVWLPVEITLLKKGFTVAWKQAARDWAEATGGGNAMLYPVRESWQTYEPVGFLEGSSSVASPESRKLSDSVSRENGKLVSLILAAGEGSLAKKAETAKAGSDRAKAQNALGIFYGRLGLTEKALAEFEKAKAANLLSAEVNIANIYLADERYSEAIAAYRAVLAKDPKSGAALFGLAQAATFSNDQKLAKETLERLEAIDPDLAAQAAGSAKSTN